MRANNYSYNVRFHFNSSLILFKPDIFFIQERTNHLFSLLLKSRKKMWIIRPLLDVKKT